MMASDLETDPRTGRAFIAEAETGAWDIVTATRWRGGARFRSYHPVKLILNFLFQKCFQALYRTRLTDLTYGFRMFRASVVRGIRWEELKHPFLFETLIKPLRLGYTVKEVPTRWEARKEGASQNTFFGNFAYMRIGVKVLCARRAQLLVKHD